MSPRHPLQWIRSLPKTRTYGRSTFPMERCRSQSKIHNTGVERKHCVDG